MLGSSRTRVPAALSSRPERISMTPRTPNTPYVRPQFPTSGGTRPPTGPGSQPADGNSQARQQLGDARGTLEMQQKIFDEVRRGREERRSIREEIRKVAQQVSKLEEQQKKLMEMAKQQNDASFTIETSVYKVRGYEVIHSRLVLIIIFGDKKYDQWVWQRATPTKAVM